MSKTYRDLVTETLAALEASTEPEAVRVLKARAVAVRFIQGADATRKKPFKACARYFVARILPTIGKDYPDFDRLLGFAGFGGEANKGLTDEILRVWKREASVPAWEDVPNQSSEWHTPEEWTAYARANPTPDLPVSLRSMERLLQDAASGTGGPNYVRKIAQ